MANERPVLASLSAIRRRMLEDAGVPVDVVASGVDEAAVRQVLRSDDDGELDGADVADVLARSKAETVSANNPGRLVIGCDQVLSCNGAVYAKAETMADARRQLLALRGKAHRLHSAVAIAVDGETDWAIVDDVDVTLREFTPEFLGHYLGTVGERCLASVGGYEFEREGAQLISKVEGDYFTVLGMPLLPVLEQLRQRGVLQT